MIKRNLDCELSARSYWIQSREMALFAIVHDVTIVLLFAEVFDRACGSDWGKQANVA